MDILSDFAKLRQKLKIFSAKNPPLKKGVPEGRGILNPSPRLGGVPSLFQRENLVKRGEASSGDLEASPPSLPPRLTFGGEGIGLYKRNF
ncbi:MAG: hypothetical protein AAB704_01825 [Patescibacteria group bacterium]